jgi:WD40 repeat protein
MLTLRFLAVAVFFAASVSLVNSAPDDPFKPAEKKAQGKTDPDDPFAPGATGGKGAWGTTPPIPFDTKTAVTFGPAGCPVAVLGNIVWDLNKNKEVGKLVGTYEAHGHRTLSADGKFFAAGAKSPNQADTAVTVWNTETGQRVLDVPGVKNVYVDLIVIARSKYLLLGGRHNATIDVHDIESGKVTKQLNVPDRRVEADKIAFTPDGTHYACIAHDKIVVTETASNKQVAVLAPPGPGVGGEPPAKGAKRNPKLDAVFVYTWTKGLAFSPDGTELAAFSTHPGPRLMVWNVKGQLVLDEPVPMPRTITHRNTLEWQPDASGWLVNGYLFDRASKRVTLSIRVPFAADIMPHLLEKGRVIGVFGDDKGKLQSFTIPNEKLAASLKVMAAKGASHLAPGKAVSLELQLTGLRGDEDETRKLLTEALTRRLARDGIPVAAGQSTVLRLRLSEEAGDKLPIFEQQSPFDWRGTATGKKATEAKGAAVLEIVAMNEEKPLWRGHLSAMSARSFREEITDATVRKSMLEHLTKQLSGMDMPYFIPKAKDTVALPAIVE